MLQRRYADAGGGQNNVRRERNQFRRILSHGICTRATPTVVDPHVAARSPPCFLQTLCERANTSVPFRIVSSQIDEHADAPHALALLRPRRERPRRRAAECGQQFPPSEGDCHTPLPCEVRKWNDTMPRACCPNSAAPGAVKPGMDDEPVVPRPCSWPQDNRKWELRARPGWA